MEKKQQQSKFIVTVRIKPLLKSDKVINTQNKSQIQPIVKVTDKTSLTIDRKNYEQKIFRFNHIFVKEWPQQIYNKCSHLIDEVFSGNNATFLAYGKTGTGKTHTVFGSNSYQFSRDSKGFFHHTVEDIFKKIEQKMYEKQFAVKVSFVGFYMNNIYDLIENDGTKLEIKQTADKGLHIQTVQVAVTSPRQLFTLLQTSILWRKTKQLQIDRQIEQNESENSNKNDSKIERASQSHAIVQIQILQRWSQEGQWKYEKGMLKIVDLAGSHKLSKTEPLRQNLQTIKYINKQLTTLNICINILAQAHCKGLQKKVLAKQLQFSNLTPKFNFFKTYIPFRDSKLTRYLTDTLEGQSKVVLCVCISQLEAHLSQTLSSLMFAERAIPSKLQLYRKPISQNCPKKDNLVWNSFIKNGQSIEKQTKTNESMKNSEAFLRIFQQIQEIQDYLSRKTFNHSIEQQNQRRQNSFTSYEKVLTVLKKKIGKEHQGSIFDCKF